MRFYSILCCVSLAALAAGPAHAQSEQTPENAQEFLSRVFGNGDGKAMVRWIKPATDAYFKTCSKDHKGRLFGCATNPLNFSQEGVRILRTAESGDVCKTNLVLDRITADYVKPAHINGLFSTTWWEWKAPEQVTLQIDWSKLSAAPTSNSWNIYGVSAPNQNLEFTLRMSSVDMATRVAFAMSVLRDHCDNTAGLGF